MAKSADAFRTISEVAEWLDTPAHVLRFWESRFNQIKPVKRAGGRRYYRPNDMLLLGGIKKLLHEDGMTIKGAQKLLSTDGIKKVSALSQSLDPEDRAALDQTPDDTVVEMAIEPSVDDVVLDVAEAPSISDDALETPPLDEAAPMPDVAIVPEAAPEIEPETVEPVNIVETVDETAAEPETVIPFEATLEPEPEPVATVDAVAETLPELEPASDVPAEPEPEMAADLAPEPSEEPVAETMSPTLPDSETPELEIADTSPTFDEAQPKALDTAQSEETQAQLVSIYSRLTALHERMKSNIDPKRQG